MTRLRHIVVFACLLALGALCAGVLAPVAAAGPPDAMDLAELSELLEAGPVSGYLKATLTGYTPQQIPVTVDSIVADPSGDLILFEATGPEIERLGSIAAGMSGSPIYVDDGSSDRLIGALSYGAEFTVGGLGLATPIEDMVAIQDAYSGKAAAPSPGVRTLSRPVKAAGRTVTRIVIAEGGDARTRSSSPSEVVMKPLGLIEIGGMRPGSRAYKDLASRLSRSGMDVRPAAGGGSYAGPPAPALQAGSPCCALFADGDIWYGAAGTVTYVDGDDVMLFGHPLEWLGQTEAILTAGYVDAAWPNSYVPYLMISPRNRLGAITQDRYCGVLADLSRTPRLTPVTVHATYPAEAREETLASNVASALIETPAWSTLPADIVVDGLTLATDAYLYPGSADVTTTVVVGDDTGTYTVTRKNIWDSSDDVAWDAAYDVADLLTALTNDSDGVIHPRLDSIHVEAQISPVRRSARIARVRLPDGLRIGATRVVIEYYKYGSAAVQQVEGRLTIPKGMPLSGELDVYPGAWGSFEGDDWEMGEADPTPPRTLAQLVEEIEAAPANNDLLVEFYPESDDDGPIATGVIPTDSVFTTAFYQETLSMSLRALVRLVPYGGATRVTGAVVGVEGDTPVRLYKVTAGSDKEVYLKTIQARYEGRYASFSTTIAGLTHTCRLVARCDATDRALPGYASDRVKVAASLRAYATVKGGKGTLVVRILPKDAVGKLVVQRRVGQLWKTWRTVKLDGSTGTTKFKLAKGTHVLRARFAGGPVCEAGTSKTVRVRVP